MNVVDFIKKKNEILFKYTGMILVPEDQIKEIEIEKPLIFKGNAEDCDICPYCQIFYDCDEDCPGCPMSEAENYCNNFNSTYFRIQKLYGSLYETTQSWHDELKELVDEFNSTYFKEKEDEKCIKEI